MLARSSPWVAVTNAPTFRSLRQDDRRLPDPKGVPSMRFLQCATISRFLLQNSFSLRGRRRMQRDFRPATTADDHAASFLLSPVGLVPLASPAPFALREDNYGLSKAGKSIFLVYRAILLPARYALTPLRREGLNEGPYFQRCAQSHVPGVRSDRHARQHEGQRISEIPPCGHSTFPAREHQEPRMLQTGLALPPWETV
jgi:hypothetical protein